MLPDKIFVLLFTITCDVGAFTMQNSQVFLQFILQLGPGQAPDYFLNSNIIVATHLMMSPFFSPLLIFVFSLHIVRAYL